MKTRVARFGIGVALVASRGAPRVATASGLGFVNEGFIRMLLSLALLLVVFTTPAWAFSITIDPAAYTGGWRFVGIGDFGGLQTFDVAEGTYTLLVAGHDGAFTFDVDASGNVTSQNSAAATGAGSTLTFNTTQISVDPGAYTGGWRLVGIGQFDGSEGLAARGRRADS